MGLPGRRRAVVGIGSHLDSVRGGGQFDGPLGVACGFEIAASAPQPVAVISFADEEGARFNTPTFGSKALSGRLDLPAVLDRRDDGDVALGDAMRAAGVDPGGLGDAPSWLEKLRGFVEIHIDQTTELAGAGQPVAVVSSLAARTRLEIRLTGRADHAGTTPRSERRDALSAAAHLIVGAEEAAGAVSPLDGEHPPLRSQWQESSPNPMHPPRSPQRCACGWTRARRASPRSTPGAPDSTHG